MKKIKKTAAESDSVNMQFNKLSSLSDPEMNLPLHTTLRPLKKLVLRIFRVYTKYQTYFNKQVVDTFSTFQRTVYKRLSDQQVELNELRKEWDLMQTDLGKKHIANIDNLLQEKFKALQKAVTQKNQSEYKSVYFPQFEDEFYLFQQEKFRGSYEMIKERQKKYNPYIKTVRKLSEDHPFVDIGFGRGEFLEILKEQKIKKILGVDINEKYCKQAKKKGYDVACGDGIEYLQHYKGKLSGLSAFHVIEHLTFDQLFDLLYLASMKMADGAFLLLETPNVENVLVSSTSFYIDHTHINKLPPEFMKSLLEFFKFKKIEILYNIQIKENYETDYDKFLFGPMDYAIVAYK